MKGLCFATTQLAYIHNYHLCKYIHTWAHMCAHTHTGWTKLSTSMTDMESTRVKCWLSYQGMSERERDGECSNVVLCAAVLNKNQTLFHCIFSSLNEDHIVRKIVHDLQPCSACFEHITNVLNPCTYLPNFHWGQDLLDMIYRCIIILWREHIRMGA